MDCDRIVVLQEGRVAEFDTRAALLLKRDSIFYSLVREAGLAEP
jgi:ATP-binding cassette subfamily C (CFTR/MRP) protein 1